MTNELDIADIKRNLHAFAEHHGILLTTKGSCGFARPCVGFLKHDKYVGYCPLNKEYSQIPELDDNRLRPGGEVPDAYHKHDCFAVLAHGEEDAEDYDTALRQLHAWIERLRKIGPLEVVSYNTGHTGVQALLSGVTSHAMKFKEPANV